MKPFILTCVSLFFILHSSLFSPSLQAQQPWNPSSLLDAHLDDAYLVAPPAPLQASLRNHLSFPLSSLFNRSYRLSLLSNEAGAEQLLFQSDSLSFSLPDTLASQLLPYLVSHRYWQQRYAALQEWAFVFMDTQTSLLIDIDTTDRRYGPYSPLSWLGYHFQPSVEWPVVFSLRTNTRRRQQLTLPALQRLAEWGSFSTVQGQSAFELRRDSLLRSRQAQQQALQHHIDSLNLRQQLLARQADSIALALRNDSLQQIHQHTLQQIQATKEHMRRNQIFLISLNPARSNFMFGLEVNLFNCFSKVISSVEISVIPVDHNGQLQPDRFKRDERTILCIGPIQPLSPAQYTFDELFWDQSHRIRFIRLTSVTFLFSDGSRRSFSGYDKILKHTLKN